MKNTAGTYQQKNWNLDELFPAIDSGNLDKVFEDLKIEGELFEKYRVKLSPGMGLADFLEIIGQIEKMQRSAHTIYSYAELCFAGDTQNQPAQSLLSKVEQFMAELGNRIMFFSLWWKSLDGQEASKFLSGAGEFTYWLEEMRHYKDHTLTEPEEKIINIKNVTGSSAIGMLYDSITNRYTFQIDVEGEKREMTRGELMSYVHMPDASMREKAYRELYRVFGNDGPILGQIYQSLVRDWKNEQVELRHFSSPICARNLANDIPDEVVDLLLDVCKKNSQIFQDYFTVKARLLGLEKLRRYDLYAPLAASTEKYTYSEAVNMTLGCFNSFDPRMAQLAENVFAKDHIDAEIRKGKNSGAFCLTALPDLVPWVLMNYQGQIGDVKTMAHEIGHAVHSMLSEHHSILTFHPCLPLAETASTFAEMLLADNLLKQNLSAGLRRDLIVTQLDDSYATIMRQAFFALFEKEAHSMIQKGATVDELSAAYFENLKGQFGDSIIVGDEFRWEWVSIPHIYNVPFYVYAYSFGQLLVLSLFAQYKQEGKAFVPRFFNILSAGGSKAPATILLEAGIDMKQASFWQEGFNVLKGMIGQLETLPG